MAESAKQPSVMVQQPNSQQRPKNDTKSSYIKDSASRIQNIAQSYGLDALLQADTPKQSTFERAQLREQRRQEQRQQNLEQVLKLAHSACRDETAGEPEQDWLYRFSIWLRIFTTVRCKSYGLRYSSVKSRTPAQHR